MPFCGNVVLDADGDACQRMQFLAGCTGIVHSLCLFQAILAACHISAYRRFLGVDSVQDILCQFNRTALFVL